MPDVGAAPDILSLGGIWHLARAGEDDAVPCPVPGDVQSRIGVPPDKVVPALTMVAPVLAREFAVVDAFREGTDGWNPLMQCIVLAGPPKRYAFPGADVLVEAVRDRPASVRLRTDKPAFFVTPQLDGLTGAFDDASVILLPGEDRIPTFRPYDGTISHPLENIGIRGLGIRIGR